MPLRLTWIRHAEKIDRVDPSWRETAARPFDSHITEEGKKNVILVQTASVLQGDLPLKLEWGLGEWLRANHPDDIFRAGTPTFEKAELAQRFKVDPGYQTVFAEASYHYPEADVDCYQRAQVFIDWLVKNEADGHFLLVTHGKVIAYVTELAGGVVTKTPTFCAITSATWHPETGTWAPHLLNYTDYLPVYEYAPKRPDKPQQ